MLYLFLSFGNLSKLMFNLHPNIFIQRMLNATQTEVQFWRGRLGNSRYERLLDGSASVGADVTIPEDVGNLVDPPRKRRFQTARKSTGGKFPKAAKVMVRDDDCVADEDDNEDYEAIEDEDDE
jgi:hypothetical protein